MSRILRTLVCLLLICSILVNLSPLKAKAVTPGMVAVGTVSALVLIPAILYGLGVMQSSTDTGSAAFNQLVSDCNDHLTTLGWIAAGAATMLSLTQDGAIITYAHRNMIQDIFDWLWSLAYSDTDVLLYDSAFQTTDSGNIVVQVGSKFYSGSDMKLYRYCTVNEDYTVTYATYLVSSTTIYRASSLNGNYFTTNSNTLSSTGKISTDVSTYQNKIDTLTAEGYTYLSSIPLLDDVLAGGYLAREPIYTTYDLTLGQVADQDTEIETGYETYIQEGIVSIDFGIGFEEGSPYDPDGDDQKYHHWLPVKVTSPDKLSELTQEDAWSGESEVELEYKTDTDTGNGDPPSDGSDPTPNNPGSSGSTWKPPSDPTHFKLVDLSKFFPFCIPFDLFDFFKLLNADPVAPSFTWEIQDLSGQTYGLTVDLSQWDSVAQLFRRLQLFLFVCGLAAASRKYIKW